jgi:hypothetical protein
VTVPRAGRGFPEHRFRGELRAKEATGNEEGGMTALSRSQRTRLCRILGMLGSAHAGERAAAALAADRLVRELGVTWDDLLDGEAAGIERVIVREWQDIFHDPLAAAESRMSQLRLENAELRAELVRLRRFLDARHRPPKSRPAQDRS